MDAIQNSGAVARRGIDAPGKGGRGSRPKRKVGGRSDAEP